MTNGDIIEMDIWSSFGCFTSPFSNVGGLLTYLIPPKTSIIGMIGSILGYNFEDYIKTNDKKEFLIEKLHDIKISIQPLFKFKTRKVTFNAHYGNEPYIMLNVKQDVLINPYYKIYLKFPENLKKEEKLFLDRVMNNETVYNLYMGRNEFFLNFKYLKSFTEENYELNNDNAKKFFENGNKVYGLLNRSLIENTKLKSIIINSNNKKIAVFNKKKKELTTSLTSYYEYVIRDYPLKKANFNEFEYLPVSFYSMNKKEDCYFTKIELKSDVELKLFNIGENRWISLI